MLKRLVSVLKLCCLKLKHGRRLKLNSFRQLIKWDTEINVHKMGKSCLGSITTQSNVHLVCVVGSLTIGDRVSFNRNCIIICRKRISIGNKCSFGPNVCIYDHDHYFDGDGFRSNEFRCSDIIIEDGCWIGAGAIILRGAHIKNNSVIGAGVIVKGVIPANSLVTASRKNTIVEIK